MLVYALFDDGYYCSISTSKNTTKKHICEIDICSLNVHNIHKHIGIRKHWKHWRLSWFRYETFIYLFEFKASRQEERETMLTIRTASALDSLTQQTLGTFRRPQTALTSASSENQLVLYKSESQPFFSNSQILSTSLPEMTSFTSPVPFPIWDFYCDICEHLHSMCAPN